MAILPASQSAILTHFGTQFDAITAKYDATDNFPYILWANDSSSDDEDYVSLDDRDCLLHRVISRIYEPMRALVNGGEMENNKLCVRDFCLSVDGEIYDEDDVFELIDGEYHVKYYAYLYFESPRDDVYGNKIRIMSTTDTYKISKRYLDDEEHDEDETDWVSIDDGVWFNKYDFEIMKLPYHLEETAREFIKESYYQDGKTDKSDLWLVFFEEDNLRDRTKAILGR